jgi:actin-related protein
LQSIAKVEIQSGGTCNLPGFADRMHKEITSIAPTTAKISLFVSPIAQHLVWKGGSMLALNADLKKFSITKAEYDEEGAAAFERKTSERY